MMSNTTPVISVPSGNTINIWCTRWPATFTPSCNMTNLQASRSSYRLRAGHGCRACARAPTRASSRHALCDGVGMASRPTKAVSTRIDPFAPRHALLSGATSVLASASGDIDAHGPAHEGLFDRDCRVLSRRILIVNEMRIAPERAHTTVLAPHRAVSRSMIDVGSVEGGSAEGPVLPQDALEIDVVRRVGFGMRERITITNHLMVERPLRIELLIDADFVDVLALDRHDRVERD